MAIACCVELITDSDFPVQSSTYFPLIVGVCVCIRYRADGDDGNGCGNGDGVGDGDHSTRSTEQNSEVYSQ